MDKFLNRLALNVTLSGGCELRKVASVLGPGRAVISHGAGHSY
jgi:hypothetical protein